MKIIKLIYFILLLTPLVSLADSSGVWKISGPLPPSISGNIIAVDSLHLFGFTLEDTSSIIFKSNDEGVTWSEIHISGVPSFSPSTICILSNDILLGYMDKSHTIAKSTDGGANWTTIYAVPNLKRFYGLKMWNEWSGYLLYSDSSNNYIDAITSDGGNTFSPLNHSLLFQTIAPLPNNKLSMLWTDSLNGCIWGPRNSKNSKLLVTHNSGKDWKQSVLKTPAGDTNISLASGGIGQSENYLHNFAITPFSWENYIYYSSNDGFTWHASDTSNLHSNISTIAINGYGSFWAAGQNGIHLPLSVPRNILLHSTDFGVNWEKDSVSLKDYEILLIEFTDSAHGLAVVYSTGNGKFYLAKYSTTTAGVNRKNTSGDLLLSIMPNPSTDVISIYPVNSVKFVRVVNIDGKEMFTVSVPADKLNISFLPIGTYFLECEDINGHFHNLKFLKMSLDFH